MPCSILFGFAHIDETRGLKRVYRLFLEYDLGNLSISIREKKSEGQGVKEIERHEWTWRETKSNERTGYVNETKTIPNGLDFFSLPQPPYK